MSLYRTSVGLGLRYLVRHGYLREAVIRVVVPLDPSRYLELPETMRELAARHGRERRYHLNGYLRELAFAQGVQAISVPQASTFGQITTVEVAQDHALDEVVDVRHREAEIDAGVALDGTLALEEADARRVQHHLPDGEMGGAGEFVGLSFFFGLRLGREKEGDEEHACRQCRRHTSAGQEPFSHG